MKAVESMKEEYNTNVMVFILSLANIASSVLASKYVLSDTIQSIPGKIIAFLIPYLGGMLLIGGGLIIFYCIVIALLHNFSDKNGNNDAIQIVILLIPPIIGIVSCMVL